MKPRRFRLHRPGTAARPALRPAAAPAPAAAPHDPAVATAETSDARAELTAWAAPAEPALLDPDGHADGADSAALTLARARQRWQQGDWAGLAAWPTAALRHHPERARLALMVAAAHLQLGASATARPLLRLAQEWGCDRRLLSQVLVAGLHNTLGRAAALNDDPARALIHFAAAVTTAAPGSAVHAAIQARARAQLAQLGLSVAPAQPPAPVDPPTDTPPAAPSAGNTTAAAGTDTQPAPRLIAAGAQCLGPCRLPAGASTPLAWVADAQCLYLAYLVDTHTLRVLRRRWSDGRLQQRDLRGDYASGQRDIALGLDAQGQLLLCYRSADRQLCWRHGSEAGDVRPWSVKRGLPASPAASLQLLSRAGQPLLLLLDDGQAPVLLQHHSQRQDWQAVPLPEATAQPGASACTLAADNSGRLQLLQLQHGPEQSRLLLQHWCAETPADGAAQPAWQTQPTHHLPLAAAAQGLALAAAADGNALQLLCAGLHGDAAVEAWHLRLGDGTPQRQCLVLPAWPALAVDASGRAWLAAPAAGRGDAPLLWHLDSFSVAGAGADATAHAPSHAHRHDWPADWPTDASDGDLAGLGPVLVAARRQNGQHGLTLLLQHPAGADADDQITLHTFHPG